MIEIIEKRGLRKRVNVFFPDNEYTTSEKCDVCCYIGIEKLHDSENKHIQFNSLLSDLRLSEDELFSQFAKVNRYDIRRSFKDDFILHFYDQNELISNNSFYNSYETVYEKMYYDKGLEAKAPIKSMKLYAQNKAMIVSSVVWKGKPIVYHTYIVDGVHARLWMSCSSFRDSDDKQFRALLGRANKRLHFEDMKQLKRLGYKSYDWGGISNPENPNGIDKFKMSFGGKAITYFDETVLESLKYRFFHKFKRMMK